MNVPPQTLHDHRDGYNLATGLQTGQLILWGLPVPGSWHKTCSHRRELVHAG